MKWSYQAMKRLYHAMKRPYRGLKRNDYLVIEVFGLSGKILGSFFSFIVFCIFAL